MRHDSSRSAGQWPCFEHMRLPNKLAFVTGMSIIYIYYIFTTIRDGLTPLWAPEQNQIVDPYLKETLIHFLEWWALGHCPNAHMASPPLKIIIWRFISICKWNKDHLDIHYNNREMLSSRLVLSFTFLLCTLWHRPREMRWRCKNKTTLWWGERKRHN